MKKSLIYLVCIFLVSAANAQTRYEEVASKFAEFYNQQSPDSLFNLYSPALKEKLTLEKTRTVWEGLHVEYGDLKSLKLLKQDTGFNMYKAGFAHQTLTLLLALSEDNLIEGYRLVPYDADKFPDQKNR